MTCPGCQRPMEKSGLLGFWIRPGGQIIQYVVCPACERVLQGSKQQADRLTAKIEDTLATRQAAN